MRRRNIDGRERVRVSGACFASTLTFEDQRYLQRCRAIEPPPDLPNGQFDVVAEIKTVWRILRSASPGEALVVFSNRGLLRPELLATALFRLLPRRKRPLVVVYGDLWQVSTGIRAVVEKTALRLIDPTVAQYVCHTRSTAEFVQEFWSISSSKLTVLPYYFALRATGDSQVASGAGYVFSGGDSGRDFGPVLQLARERPDVRFVINTTRLGTGDVPSNVELKAGRAEEFSTLLEGAAAVILPLRTDLRRGVGTLTMLLAASLEKPLIVTSAFGVAEYLTHGEHALFVDGSIQQYRAALDYVIDPAQTSEVTAMAKRAREHVTTQFTLERHVDGLLRAVDSVVEAQTGRGSSPWSGAPSTP